MRQVQPPQPIQAKTEKSKKDKPKEDKPKEDKPKEDLELDVAIQESIVLANEEKIKRKLQQQEEDKMLEVILGVNYRKL
jgi:hypothetical protein